MVENGTETNEEKQETTTDNLPLNCFPLAHQVAGHFYGKGKTKLGLLQTMDGYVLKPVQSPPRGEREHNFFKKIFSNKDNELNEDEKLLKNLLPTYRGSYVHNDITYIKMDDVAYGIKHPAVIDFKIGQVTHDPEATIEKITRQKSKYPPVEKIGFQLIGMRVFDKKDNSFSHYDKIFGRGLSEEDLIHGLALYYQFHQTPQIRAIKETIKKFEEIRCWFEKQTSYHFYSSSLIVIYEANLEDILASQEQNQKQLANSETFSTTPTSNNNKSDSLNLEQDNSNNNNNNVNLNNNLNYTNKYKSDLVRIVMADFAHVFPANDALDTNYLFGLKKLIEHLKLLLSSDYKFKDVRS